MNNQPVVWTDRANQPLLQQAWLRFGRSVVTSGTTDPTFGFQVDVLTGSDYRFTLPRGLLNSQLRERQGQPEHLRRRPDPALRQRLRPHPVPGHRVPRRPALHPLGRGEPRSRQHPAGHALLRLQLLPPVHPLRRRRLHHLQPRLVRHVHARQRQRRLLRRPLGGDALRRQHQVDPAQAARTPSPLATSFGRGKFNAGDPFAPATVALANEPAGRNNFNAFDLVWTHTFNAELAYNAEGIYGYQSNVPGIANATGYGTANWALGGAVPVLHVSPESCWRTLRLETFDDFQGQRTGFRGLYTAVTGGLQYKPHKSVIFRPEIRYDYNNDSRPFEGKHGLLFGGTDIILRF